MRQGFGGEFLYNEKGEFAGINLGFDYCAEHEWGISPLNARLGISDNPNIEGFERRRVTAGESACGGYVSVDKEEYFYIYSANIKHLLPEEKNNLGNTMRALLTHIPIGVITEYGFASFWDETGFQIVLNKDFANFGEKLLNAIRTNDVLLYLSGGKNPFGGHGLQIVILSKMDSDYLEDMRKKDADKNRLLACADATGIVDVLKKAGKGFYALCPRWADDRKKSVVFWLNPMRQDCYNYGWYTVHELRLWAKEKGPVVKKRMI